ncbi:MAG: hypothetical protein M1821_001222 [Bathelium mastoideum]|nr:MAG: hypothetical protein M1821_001222 [Bathelium mastoideum]
MAPVIWGLDLGEMKWSKFKGSNMWNGEWHLRRTKFIIYQLAMITTVVSESLGTDALSDYVQQEDHLSHNGYTQLNNDFVGIASYNIFNGIYVATIFGGGFFFDLFWPARAESHSVRVAWKVCGILACLSTCATAIAMTYIVFTGHATIPGHVPADVLAGLPKTKDAPLSTILLWFANNHNEVYGAEATHVRQQQQQEKHDLEAQRGGTAVEGTTPQMNGNTNGAVSQPQVIGNGEPKPEHVPAPAQANGPTQNLAQGGDGTYAGT